MQKIILVLGLLLSVLLVSNESFGGFWDQVQSTSQKFLQGDSKSTAIAPPKLSQQDIISGLKDALRVGADTIVGKLGQKDAFYKNKNIHIPLPENLKIVQSSLGRLGMSSLMDDLELRLNRAAEKAVPKAAPIFKRTIKDMSFDDAMAVYKGSDDAATRYFEDKMTVPLQEAMRPIVQDSLAQAGAVSAYNLVMGKYKSLPFVPDVEADMTGQVLDHSLAALFDYLAKEESAIRHDPIKRTTSILQKIFSTK